jgi:CDP-diacylglycerol--glycerol-3-phosphate 3-phosphatidyltransferase
MESTDAQNVHALQRLRRQRAAITALSALVMASVALLLSVTWTPIYALRWALLAGLALAYQTWLLWRHLPDNHRAGEGHLLPDLGLANLLSLLRGMLLSMLTGFLLLPWPVGWLAWAPGTLYTSALVVDYLDGLAARTTGHVTALGGALDLAFDGLGVLVATLLAVWYGQLPVWLILAGAARYLFVLGSDIRRRQQKPVYDLPPSIMRRPMAGFLMGFTSAMLWPVLAPPLTTILAVLFAIPFLAGFLRDWLVVSGVIHAGTPRYHRVMAVVGMVAGEWLPPLLRASMVLGAAILLRSGLASTTALFVGSLAALAAVGAAGRLAGLLLAITLSLVIASGGGGPIAVGVAAAGVVLMQTGTGRLSLWRPEDVFLTTHYGGRRSRRQSILRVNS